MKKGTGTHTDALTGETFIRIRKDFSIGRCTKAKVFDSRGCLPENAKSFRFLAQDEYLVILRACPDVLDQLRFKGMYMDFLYRNNADVTIQNIYMRMVPFEAGIFKALQHYRLIRNDTHIAQKVVHYYVNIREEYRNAIRAYPFLQSFFRNEHTQE